MVPFLRSITVALAGMGVASVGTAVDRRELRMESNSRRSQLIVDVECTDTSQSKFVFNSFLESNDLANITIKYLQAHDTSDSVYTTYFGAGRTSDTTQLDVYSDVTVDGTVTLSCSDPNSLCTDTVPAYPASDGSSSVFFCPSFFNQVTTPSLCSGTTIDSGNIRGGTMLSMLSTVLSITDQSSSGCSNARSLASSDPNSAGTNADNYSCFAMQVYANAQCPSAG